MTEAKAFAPGNVSCVFKIVLHEEPERMHSLGMGFTVADGVIATVSRARRTSVLFNGEEIDFPTVRDALSKLTAEPLRVDLATRLPLSGGFGLSGASSLAAVFAANALLGLGRPVRALGMAAHVAEVENLTGLGDVAGQFHGGCLVKLVSGDPLAATPLPVPEQEVYYRYFSPIHTKEVLGSPEQRRSINAAADEALEALARLCEEGEASFRRYVAVAKRFAIESRLLRDAQVRAAIEAAEAAGGAASMIMLGNAVFSDVPFPDALSTRLSHRCVEVLA